MSVIHFDAFSGAAGTLLGRAADVGGVWGRNANATLAGPVAADGSGFVAAGSAFSAAFYLGASDYGDGEVATVYVVGSGTGLVGPALGQSTTTVTSVWARYNESTGVLECYQFVSGTFSQIGGSYSEAHSPGDVLTIRLRRVGSAITVYLNGTLRISGTTTLGQGRPGFIIGSTSGTPSAKIDSYSYDDLTTASLTPGTASASSIEQTTLTIATTVATGGTGPYSYKLQHAADVSGAAATYVDGGSFQSGLNFHVTGLTAATPYWFRVIVQDSAGTPATATGAAITATTMAAVATSYTLTGPSSGVVNTTSANFTLTPNGPFTGSITITPSGGGLSTPIVKTFSGATTPQTFAITPTAIGNVTLTPSNSGSLANPSAATYATNASAGPLSVPATATAVYYSPGNWAIYGSNKYSPNCGAYFIVPFTGTMISFGVNVSRLVAASAASANYPEVQYRIDGGAWTRRQLQPSDTSIAITGLSAGWHTLRVEYVAQSINVGDTWGTVDGVPPIGCLEITGFTVSTGGSVGTYTPRATKMLVFADSYGVGANVLSGNNLSSGSDASQSAARFIAEAHNAEVGHVCWPTQGYEQAGAANVPNLQAAYKLVSKGVSRISAGTLIDQPDIIVDMHGRNGTTTSAAVQAMLANYRAIAPTARIYLVVTFDGSSGKAAKVAGLAAYLATHPSETRMSLADPGRGLLATWTSFDGVHANQAGQAMWAAAVMRQMGEAIPPAPRVDQVSTFYAPSGINSLLL